MLCVTPPLHRHVLYDTERRLLQACCLGAQLRKGGRLGGGCRGGGVQGRGGETVKTVKTVKTVNAASASNDLPHHCGLTAATPGSLW